MEDETQLRYWRADGAWKCAIPRDDYATAAGLDWRRYGLIGNGATPHEALEDWRAWQRASDFVASIY